MFDGKAHYKYLCLMAIFQQTISHDQAGYPLLLSVAQHPWILWGAAAHGQLCSWGQATAPAGLVEWSLVSRCHDIHIKSLITL